jgi:hypothetical protein
LTALFTTILAAVLTDEREAEERAPVEDDGAERGDRIGGGAPTEHPLLEEAHRPDEDAEQQGGEDAVGELLEELRDVLEPA